MSVETAEDLAVFFNPAEFGTAARYFAPSAGPADWLPCALLVSGQDRQVASVRGRAMTAGTMIHFMQSEVPSPERDGRFVVGSQTYTIVSDSIAEDAERKIWSCTAVES